MAERHISAKHFVFISQDDFSLYRFRLPLMLELLKSGARVTALIPKGEYAKLIREKGIDLHTIHIDRKTLNPIKAWYCIRKLATYLEKLKPDVLHAFMLRPNLYGSLAGHISGTPIIICTVEGLGTLYVYNDLRTRLIRQAVELVTKMALKYSKSVIFLNSDDLNYFVNNKLCNQEQARLIPSIGIDINKFSPYYFSSLERKSWRQRWGLEPDAVVVTMIARLIAPKGVREFLEVASQLRDQARFVLVGSPDPGNPESLSKSELDLKIKQSNVIAPGWQNDIRPWLASSDIFLLPSYREGFPVTILEAMAMGLPVVGTEVPGCRDAVVTGETGILVPPRDVHGLSVALCHLIDNEELRKQFGAAGRKRVVNNFSIEKINEQYISLYDKLLCDI